MIQNAVDLAEKSTGTKIDINAIDFNDQEVLESIGSGRTDGVFQLESAGMKSFMKELKPKSLEDIIAGISLYRPGPMDLYSPRNIKGKTTQGRSRMTARSLNRSWRRLTDVLSIRNRLCRSCVTWQVTPSEEATF